MQCHIIVQHQVATTATTATTAPLRPPVEVLPWFLNNVMPGQYAEWAKRWSMFVAATAITSSQLPSYLTQAIGESMASQVLVEFVGGILTTPFDDLLAAVKRHAVTPEVVAVRRCAANVLKQCCGESAQHFVGRIWHMSVACE